MKDTINSPAAPHGTDRIDKQVHVRANRTRVWRAISDAEQFGTWFGMTFAAPFTPGSTILGRLTMPGYEHLMLEMQIETIEPESYFAYRWHPYAIDSAIDYSAEPTTLVEFRLRETAEGTEITITESGFDQLPPSRRAEAFRMNTAGWDGQSRKLVSYVS
jgi:uncharacterized protein YndB with AHSA1/START domain